MAAIDKRPTTSTANQASHGVALLSLFRPLARVVEDDTATVPRQAVCTEGRHDEMKLTTRNSTTTPLVQRAYQLARSGAFAGLREISDRLKREGYSGASVYMHLEGKAIRADLKRFCNEAMRPKTL